MGDPFKLRQILANLIGNALKFTHEGKIDLNVKKLAEYSDREIKLEFSIKDTGIGINNDKIGALLVAFIRQIIQILVDMGALVWGLQYLKDWLSK